VSAESLDLFAPPAYAPPVDDVRAFDAASPDPLPAGVTMLEASAGTGKTYGIASVVLRLVVEEGLGIDEILVVTFTEAATAELRDRVRRRLRDALALAERALAAGAVPAGDPVAAHDAVARALVARALAAGTLGAAAGALRDALARFDDAPIATIHGFCRRVLRERAFECGGELDAELLADDAELLESVVRDFWAAETARRPVALVRALVGRGGVGLPSLLALARRATPTRRACRRSTGWRRRRSSRCWPSASGWRARWPAGGTRRATRTSCARWSARRATPRC
jgi:superfamily I DNA/RNA helicase